MEGRAFTLEDAHRVLDRTLHFPASDETFERLQPITDFRKDDSEARILYLCRRLDHEGHKAEGEMGQRPNDDIYVLKCKIQVLSVLAGGLREPVAGPSELTIREIEALTIFAKGEAPALPHLITWKATVQASDGLMPGGYVAYVVMTRMPGEHLLQLKFWSMSEPEQEEIREAFIGVLKSIWALGFEPYDCALRNILWEKETKTLSIVDFEHWHRATQQPATMDVRAEMQKWGLIRRPPPLYHWQEWRHSENASGHPQKW